MAGSKHFTKKAKRLIDDTNSSPREREERWRTRQQVMQQLQLEHQQRLQEQKQVMTSEDIVSQGVEASRDAGSDSGKKKKGADASTMACACDANCNYSVVLANLSRVLWMAYEEYELLHACYADIFAESYRHSLDRRVDAYWKAYVPNPVQRRPHKHVERLLKRSEKEREVHLREKKHLPVGPVAPVHRSLLRRLLDPFGSMKCRCLRCAYLDAVMDYRVALFRVLKEYCALFEDYARLVWSSKAKVSDSGLQVTLEVTDSDAKMFRMMMTELYSRMSFSGDSENIMTSLKFMRNLINR